MAAKCSLTGDKCKMDKSEWMEDPYCDETAASKCRDFKANGEEVEENGMNEYFCKYLEF